MAHTYQTANPSDTIYAPATAVGRAAVAIVRVSGSRSDEVLAAFLGGPLPAHRMASLRAIRDPGSGDLIDQALVLRFAKAASFTGEESFELHLHGAPVLVRQVSRALDGLDVRLAVAGEFAWRAHQNERLDAAQLAGLADLINAESETAARRAAHMLDGALGRKVAGWRDRLLEITAFIEASIDFSEEDIELDIIEAGKRRIVELEQEIAGEVKTEDTLDPRSEPMSVAIIGPPNAGKSTLLNALTGYDAAIVSDQPGTTRDALRIQGWRGASLVTFIDTAGQRATDDEIESLGIDRARSVAKAADRRILMVAIDSVQTLEAFKGMITDHDLVLVNKADLGPDAIEAVPDSFLERARFVSVFDGTALQEVNGWLDEQISAYVWSPSVLSDASQRSVHLKSALENLRAGQAALSPESIEIAAEHLRAAAHRLQSFMEPVTTEEMLGAIFSRFCIGK